MAQAADSTSPERPGIRSWTVAFVLLALASIASRVFNLMIVERFPDRPSPRDALFELIPYVSEVRYVSAIALVAGLLLFAYYAVRIARDDLPRIISLVSLMYLFRAFMIILTPLASSHGSGVFVFPLVQYGMFPSGHAGVMMLAWRLTDARRAPGLRRALMWLAWIEFVSLIAAHGHYSIDVVGGVLLAYFVEMEWTRGRLFDPIKRAMGAG